MSLVIGMDEAGYGPNLGPLVITASSWIVPGDARQFDFWTTLQDAVCQQPTRDDRLHIADSKQVYSASRGIAPLERSVLAVLGLLGECPATFRQLIVAITGSAYFLEDELWFRDVDQCLPLASDSADIADASTRLKAALDAAGVQLKTIRSDVVLTERFNLSVVSFDNKAGALSDFAFKLMQQVWPTPHEPTLVIGDKHGGRNRYDDLIAGIIGDEMIFRQEEGRALSRYKVGQTELRFQTGAEAHFPVAVSSMVCKYAREVSMELFNRFWLSHVPGLKPTKGYPEDAKRFRADIGDMPQQLGLADSQFWRCR